MHNNTAKERRRQQREFLRVQLYASTVAMVPPKPSKQLIAFIITFQRRLASAGIGMSSRKSLLERPPWLAIVKEVCSLLLIVYFDRSLEQERR
jgi:hypothetical protein